MRYCLNCLAALLSSLLLLLSGTANALPAYTGTLATKASQEHPLPAQAGDYVQGRLSGHGMRLVLLDRHGQRVRVLSQGRRDIEEFMFVVGADGPYRFDVRAPNAGAYRLELLQQIPHSAQVSPQEIPDSPRLRALQQNPAGLAEFWAEVQRSTTPLVESIGVSPALAKNERLVTFLWRGAERRVRLFGGPSADHDELQRLPDTDVWYRSYRLPDTTRLAYRLAPDVPELNAAPYIRRRAILATAQRDPFNPRSTITAPLDRFDAESLFELPAAPKSDWDTVQQGIPTGNIETLRLSSKILGNARDIHIYRPANWSSNAPQRALLVVFDGEHYIRTVPTPVILDNLIARERLPITAAIFITNPSNESRSKELPPNEDFSRFLAEELMPWVQSHGISAPPERTIIAGASYGGLAALWAGYSHPELFGKVYCQSGSFWWAPGWENASHYNRPTEWLTGQIANSPKQALQIHLEAGLFELGRDNQPGIRDTSQHLLHVLQAKGYTVSYREYAAAHGYEHWRQSFADGLLQLLGKPLPDAGSKPASAL